MACEIPWGFDLITTKAQQNAMQRQLEGSRFCVAGETVVCVNSDWKPCEIAPDGTVTAIEFPEKTAIYLIGAHEFRLTVVAETVDSLPMKAGNSGSVMDDLVFTTENRPTVFRTALPTMSWREIKSEDMTHCLPSAGRR